MTKFLVLIIGSVLAFIPVSGMFAPTPQPPAQPAAAPQGIRLVADISDRALYVLDGSKQYSFPAGFGPTTPLGRFAITSKIADPIYEDPNTGAIAPGVLGPWFFGFKNTSRGYYGIHAGDIITPSNGCIRLREPDVRAIAAVVEPGVPLEIRP